jgi:FkbM family methyltransferase
MNKIYDIIKTDVMSFLDIGANVGSFAMSIRNTFPDIEMFLIEANPFCDNALRNTGIPYQVVCLSDKEQEVKFFFEDNNFQGTGASYYIEKTIHYSKKNFTTIQTKLLDDVIFSNFGNYKKFDFIKMDTQGSELDILRGAKKTADHAKYILIETSLVEYNENAPLQDEVFKYMNSIGFKPVELIETHLHNNVIVQEDWIFTR